MGTRVNDTLDSLAESGIKYREVCGSPKYPNLIEPTTHIANPETATAVKFDQEKPPTHLMSNIAAKRTARVLAFGAKKYAEHNWRKGMEWHRLLRAARDHICDFIDGEDNDPESGLCHLDHAACCIMFLQEYLTTHPELDTRYKPKMTSTEKSEAYKELYEKLLAERNKELNTKKYSPIQETM